MADYRRRGIYLLPNLLTTAGIFFGFYAIMSAVAGNYVKASVAIFVCMVFDLLDGRVARLTHTQSEFGTQYDSLTDLISFGVAPALLIYQSSLFSVGKFGWAASFAYTAAAALRLARFNAQGGTVDKRYFQGLSSPAAAGVMAGYVWLWHDINWMEGEGTKLLSLFITLAIALLMVSNIRYRSFKDINFRSRVSFLKVLGVALAFVLLSLKPSLILFLSFVGYAVSGVALTLLRVRQYRRFRLRPRKG